MNDRYCEVSDTKRKRRIPIGVEDFKRMIDEDYYYVDKTDLIQELLEHKSIVTLFTRPRRFGKTLNMSMLKYFFECPTDGHTNKSLFTNLKIMEAEPEILEYQENFPVIALSLKSAKQPTYELAYAKLVECVIGEFQRHAYILEGDKLSAIEKERFIAIMRCEAAEEAYVTALEFLSKCLEQYHGCKTIVMIDEYDVPLENAFFQGFYDRMVMFMRSLFESVLKTNGSLELAVITGCLRISKESIFTGLNNLLIISILDRNYGEYFGFSETEVATMLEYYERSSRIDTMRQWYDGYNFGTAKVYNPWSVLNFVYRLEPDENAIPVAEWANTSSNSIVRELVYRADKCVKEEIQGLVNGETIEKRIHEDITYEDVYQTQDNLWNFLLFTGYLTAVSESQLENARYAKLKIPNIEIETIYHDQITNWFQDEIKMRDLSPMYEAMLHGNVEVFELELGKLLRETISYMDSREAFYHGFVLGTLVNLKTHGIKSNREAGDGRFDIIVYDDNIENDPVILEFKVAKSFTGLEETAGKGVQQILDKGYANELAENGYRKVLCYGIGFFRKQVRIRLKLLDLR